MQGYYTKVLCCRLFSFPVHDFYVYLKKKHGVFSAGFPQVGSVSSCSAPVLLLLPGDSHSIGMVQVHTFAASLRPVLSRRVDWLWKTDGCKAHSSWEGRVRECASTGQQWLGDLEKIAMPFLARMTCLDASTCHVLGHNYYQQIKCKKTTTCSIKK
jgi:hypothetical protein